MWPFNTGDCLIEVTSWADISLSWDLEMLSLVAKQKYYRYIFLAKYVLLFIYILTLIEWERICVFFYCLFISALPWRSSYQKGGVIPLIGLTPPHLCARLTSHELDLKPHMSWSSFFLFSMNWGGCWCWYNWWPSLFKLSFHNDAVPV